MFYSKIISTGGFLPEKILTNDDLSKFMDTSDDWITSRTGIKQRHILEDGKYTSDMAKEAALLALERAKITADMLDYIIVATTTPDKIFPSTACYVQSKIGAKNAIAFDIQAVCSGFIYGFNIADSLIKTQNINYILLIGADSMTRILNWEDRSTSVLFGDGAGAILLKKESQAEKALGIIAAKLYSNGDNAEILCTNGQNFDKNNESYLTMNGKEVYKKAIFGMYNSIINVTLEAGISLEEIDYFILHQANLRIIESIANKLNISLDKFIKTIDHHSNTSAGTIPLALDHLIYSQNTNLSGKKIIFSSFGAGSTWGSILYKF